MAPPPVTKPMPALNGHEVNAPGPNSSASKELSYEERRTMWVDRIKLLSEAVVAYGDFARLQKEAEQRDRLSQAWRSAGLSEDNKARLSILASDTALKRDARKAELNKIHARLVDTDFWPTNEKSPPSLADSHKDMHATIAELKGSVANLHQLLEQIRAEIPKSLDIKPTPVDIPAGGSDATRPAKRRRVSVSEDDAILQQVDQKQTSNAEQATDELRDRLLLLEQQLSEIQNEIAEHDNDLLYSMEEMLQSRLETGNNISEGAQASTRDERIGPPDKAHGNEHLGQELDILGGQVEELAVEVANIITRMNASDSEYAKLRTENEHLRKRIDDLEQRYKSDMDRFQTNKLEMQALSAAVTSFMTQAKPSPMLQFPAIEDILTEVRPAVLQSLQADVKPLLQTTHENLSNMLQEQHNMVYAAVMSKMTPAIDSMRAVSTWLERLHTGEIDAVETLNTSG
ncbi:uncharacterized protein FIBRA_04152 [Fibroporia radiculosa]|uniref:Uncharacterized protein n=1 Tax=Fibroporia radiculosa TaxID=599839 RepID=J4GNY3_9APHY|nr:uncharacterized protein FIBRA_04152 [Fibroporia radiculosa]CCM02075.1 predicted protein [Fibroporia radiculosa]